MTHRIGLAITPDAIRALLTDSTGTIRWHGETAWTPEIPLRDPMTTLLQSITAPGWPKPAVMVSVSAPFARTKVLRSLPASTDTKLLSTIVHQNMARFFVRSEIPRTLTGVRLVAPGEIMIGTVQTPILDAIREACEAAGFRLGAVIPQAIATDAHAAARIARDEPVAIRPKRGERFNAAVPSWRIVLAGAAAGIALLFAMLSPGLAAQRDARHAAADLQRLTASARSASDGQRQLDVMTRDLDQIAAFTHERRSLTQLLGDLASALPASSAISTLRMDSATVDLVIVSTRAASVLGSLDGVPNIVSPEIVGPVTREMVGQKEMERATIRFHLAPVPTTPDASQTTPLVVNREPLP